MRHETKAEDIHRFMQRIGAAVREEGRVYFTGGVSAVLHEWRQMTVAIDLRSDPEPAGFFEAIHRLKDELKINIELACPSDFIPTLPGWRARSVFIARHGRAPSMATTRTANTTHLRRLSSLCHALEQTVRS